MTTKFPLQRMYQDMNRQSRMHLTSFFAETLEISDSTWETYVDELKALKLHDCKNSDTIAGVYKALNELRLKIVVSNIER